MPLWGYRFGYSDVTVDCPGLDNFLMQLKTVCDVNRVRIELEQGDPYGDGDRSAKLLLLPSINNGDGYDWPNFFDLRESAICPDALPWLRDAMQRYDVKVKEHKNEKRRLEAERQRALAVKQSLTRETEMKEKGIQLSDGVYRLVKDEG